MKTGCTTFKRSYSSIPHIQNIYKGDEVFLSYIDYLAGRRSGLYIPSLPPAYEKKKQEKKRVDYLAILEEAWRECVRNKVQQSLSRPSSHEIKPVKKYGATSGRYL
jgi:hypothetical protein